MKKYLYLKQYPLNGGRHSEIPYIELSIRKDRITLNWICVPDELRRKGLAIKLLKELFRYMRHAKIDLIYFTNVHTRFWKMAVKKFPNKIKRYKLNWSFIMKRG